MQIGMNWDNARYVLAIARTGSLRKAAASLDVDQATVARRLRTLENELNVNLVDRQPEGYQLTDIGKQLVIDIEQMEAAAARLVQRSRGINNVIGTIHITATESVAHCFVLPAIRKLKANTPDIHIHLDASPLPVDMRRRHADIAIRNVRPSEPNIVIRRLATFELGLYASKNYLHERGFPVPGNALAGHDLIMYPQKTLPQYWQQLCGQAITNANIVLETQSQWNYINALKQGLGIGMMARQIVEKCCPELVHISSLGHELTDIWLVVNPEIWPSENIQAAVSAIAETFKE
ncbi:MAG: HTH-type transcriptional regulator HdfR [Candidatus Celerinatantimonas neptuna]|nr:MAG: HTH-type transcriptional regulator HdfR [Candidatus Celerinatantimonas neptuna]